MMTLVSCKIYMPQPVPIPLLSSSGDLQVSAGISVPPALNAFIAYSPLNHTEIQVYSEIGPETGRNIQGAAGYYWKNTQNLSFEVLGGINLGNGKAVNNTSGPSMEGHYKAYFGQFNFGQTAFGTRNIDYGVGLKTGMFSIDVTDRGYYENQKLDPNYFSNQYLSLEPMAFIRIGKGRLRSGFQISGSSLIGLSSKQKPIPYHSLTLGITLNYSLSKIHGTR